ncbi:hypothetical protein OZN62_08640 [Aurantiacibacter sp. MUD11]|uniref:hypothetical protein n=1 Tax=Aurantiacibacter sp. MUD11 TaxID=3003265 RepID=UPI0022AA0E51|nr:hypothetical protein [Aurantiacibacter sp. MUD11]WAT17008.1 hypothetical protein OZN62_08640 [Aurantiacibacter sp. MUD11]
MKKIVLVAMGSALSLTLVACGDAAEEQAVVEEDEGVEVNLPETPVEDVMIADDGADGMDAEGEESGQEPEASVDPNTDPRGPRPAG